MLNNRVFQLPEPVPQEINFISGLDQITPSRRAEPGALRIARNVEVDINGGLTTPTGYERYDGLASPSDAQYVLLNVTITGSFTAGDTVTGADTGATGVIVAGGVVTSGAQDYLIMTKVTGTFNSATEDLSVSASVEGNADAAAATGGASTPLLNAQYLNAAADVYRADISAVPGTGDILGLHMLSDVTYAWRNEAAYGTVNLDSGSSGSVDGITVNSVAIMSGAVNFDTDLATTATAVAANINANTSSPNYTANAVGPLVKIRALVDNSFVVVSSVTTIGSTDVNMTGHGIKAEIYKSSSTGWTLVPLGFELSFTSGGTTEIAEGDTVTGATSGATAVLTRVALESGTWAAGTAAGKLIFAVQSGTFQSENIDVGAAANLATIAADSTAITLLGSGTYEFDLHNFGGQAGSLRIYGVDGKNRGFEFDGSVYVPIKTGMAVDTPTHISGHKNHLFFSFDGSAQHSGIGTPYAFTVITGASELALGEDITAFKVQPSGTPLAGQGQAAMAVVSRNRVHILYGSSSSDWSLDQYRDEVGAFAHTVQEFGGMTLFLDDRGVSNLLAVQEYGNFQHNTLSRQIQTFMNEKKTLATTSSIARDKSQYRIFFSDSTALYITTENRKVLGMVPQTLAHPVLTMFSLENTSGIEVMMFGSEDGMVYQMERGTSYDGGSIDYLFHLHYLHSGSTRREKHYQDISFEITGGGYAEFDFTYELQYSTTDIPQGESVTKSNNFVAGSWDISGQTWDTLFWDGASLSPTQVDLDGAGTNISPIIASSSDHFAPIVFSGLLMHFIWGVELRG